MLPVPRTLRARGVVGPRGVAARLATVLAVLGLVATVAAVRWGASPQVALSTLPDLTPVARASAPVATVGPLFTGSGDHHSCTASVVASAGHDLALTAAHCLSGTGAGARFAPGYSDGRAPYGTWTVQAAWVDARWRRDTDARDDIAVLRIAPHDVGGHDLEVQDVVGAEQLLATRSALGSQVTVPAYPAGTGGSPLTCTARLRTVHGVPSFDCSGYVGGTSGGPYLLPAGRQAGAVGAGSDVVGLVGGRHEGGCYDWRSFTSDVGPAVEELLERAASGAAGDVLPHAAGPGC